MWLGWDVAAVASVILAAFGVLARSARRRDLVLAAGIAREAALVLVLYAVWQKAGELAGSRVNGGISHGRDIWHLEQALHFPSELSVQRLALPHPLFVQACNAYYAVAHAPALIVFLLWLFFRHRPRYARWRNCLALSTAACFLVQMVPVAPPRMFGGLGFVDTGLRYGQSVYGSVGGGVAPQLSAMPSVHVGWAVLIALAAVEISTSRWRWLVIAHPVATVIVVVATANHWWLDGVVAIGFLALALMADRGWRELIADRRRSPGVARLACGAVEEPRHENGVAAQPGASRANRAGLGSHG
jgi:hypothetical protein